MSAPDDVKIGQTVAIWHVRGSRGRAEIVLHAPYRSQYAVALRSPKALRSLILVLQRALEWMESDTDGRTGAGLEPLSADGKMSHVAAEGRGESAASRRPEPAARTSSTIDAASAVRNQIDEVEAPDSWDARCRGWVVGAVHAWPCELRKGHVYGCESKSRNQEIRDYAAARRRGTP